MTDSAGMCMGPEPVRGVAGWDIVGMSAIACLGDSPGEIFQALCEGRTGIAPLRAFDESGYRVKQAYEIDDRAVPGADEPGRATRWLRLVVGRALRDAGLFDHAAQYPVIVGTTLRELRSAELWWRDDAPLESSDLHFAKAMHESFGTSRTHTVASACAASLYALGLATDMIALSQAETVVVAGTDSITESAFGGLDRVQQPSPDSIRPFDRARRGMIMGEGAVAVVLSRPGAHERPAYARVRGVSMNCDAFHAAVPDVGGVTRVIRAAHERAEVKPEDIDLVIVHGSGTRHNDEVESLALTDVFAQAAPGPLVTSIKSGVGHTCGGSGLLSLVVAVLALRLGAVPPIRDLTDRMPEAEDLRLVAGEPAVGDFTTAQIHAIGLGGINAVAVVEKVES